MSEGNTASGKGWRLFGGDCRETLATRPAKSVHCCITSPPYFGLRSYLDAAHPDKAQEIGTEQTPAAYVAELVSVFREVRRVLRDDGTVWLNLGDSYAGSNQTGGTDSKEGSAKRAGRMFHAPRASSLPAKNLIGIPWRVAFALQDDGWILRSDIIWAKPNPMPESVTDRPTKAHEYVFLLTKSERYFYDADAIREPNIVGPPRVREVAVSTRGRLENSPYRAGIVAASNGSNIGLNPNGRNKRSVWTVATEPCVEAHFAVMPTALVKPCVRAGCPAGGTVLDPFAGSGTTGLVAVQEGRAFIGLELNREYMALAAARLTRAALQERLEL